ncbi:RadC family protein [Brevundimonas goettingensis]|uniref:DNA repair protein RadC n=1 Tax=Brevundimonas goettingensis TaxID=2774190 RepID=A0A975GXF5_9CAUL|nr:DNA repair protein RadC [Brevundimonas goettingensis]QTC92829.1 DNA repair protein RadC [Brevundimonas goettingensis]
MKPLSRTSEVRWVEPSPRGAARRPPGREVSAPEPSCLAGLDDRVLLALLLDRWLPPAEVDAAAQGLIARFGSLGDIAAAEIAELGRVAGISAPVIRDLKLLRELSVRLARSAASTRPVLSSWSALLAYARTTLAHLPREQFRALYLDRRNRLLGDELVADGTVDHAPVYPREVIRRALELSASALILVHNHPSGDPAPSQADIAMTRQIVEAAGVFGLQVHDHLVVGREGTASFRALGLL